VATNPIQALSHDLLIQKMVGRELTAMFHKEETPVASPSCMCGTTPASRFAG